MDISKFHLITHTPQNISLREHVVSLIKAGMVSADPVLSVQKHFRRRDGVIIIGNKEIQIETINNIYLVSIGKAAIPMLKAATFVMKGLNYSGLAVTKNMEGFEEFSEGIQVICGDHPIPGGQSLEAGRRVMSFLSKSNDNDVVIFLISGGGSSLITFPPVGLQLEDLQSVTNLMLNTSVSIQEINTIRKHLDLVKGGGLLKHALPARVITLILSDVIGNNIDTVASGVSVPDTSTFKDCINIIDQHGFRGKLPKKVLRYLIDGNNGKIAETIKPGQISEEKHTGIVVGSLDDSIKAIINQGEKLGYCVISSKEYLSGYIFDEQKRIMREFRSQLTQYPKQDIMMVWGGEVTIHRKGTAKGGRNQHMALLCAREIQDHPDIVGVTLATDGEDGSTDAAGAIFDGNTIKRAQELNLNIDKTNQNQNSYRFFETLNDLIKTGSTGTNVNDIVFLIRKMEINE